MAVWLLLLLGMKFFLKARLDLISKNRLGLYIQMLLSLGVDGPLLETDK
jgi:hypothetical protein